jgi:hypothetical protein
VALVIYKDESVQVVSDAGFMNTFLKRANDDFWKTIGCIQTNIKSRLGCGTPVIIKFFAPVNPDDPEDEIIYDYKAFGQDEELIKIDSHQYCLKQCYKMCYYIQKVYQYEVLKMRTEFMKDENGTIWFFYATQI